MITEIAHAEGVKVLVDGAQSFGATSKGRHVGAMGDATTTSFFPAKPLGCYGDGGAIFTNNESLAGLVNSIRLHGKGREKYDNVRIGLNSRLDTIQAAILIEKLKIFDQEIILRQRVASRYSSALGSYCRVPKLIPEVTSAWAQYTLILDDRDRVQSRLKELEIPSVIYYPIPLTKQLGYTKYPQVLSQTPVSDTLSSSVLSLPMHPYLSCSVQDQIIEKVIASLNY
jgi:dTDP-4-amino-4,6-dideoxygalactose transaminase